MQMNFAYQFPISTQPVTKLQRYSTSRVSWRLGTYVALGMYVARLARVLLHLGQIVPAFPSTTDMKKKKALGEVESEEPGIRCHFTTTTFNPT